MRRLLSFLILSILTVSCEKEYVIWKKNYVIGDFSGIILTDDYGNPQRVLGVDDGDWTLNDEFNEKELGLFTSDFNTVSDFATVEFEEPGDHDMTNMWVHGMRIPTEDNLHVIFKNIKSEECKVKLILVDSEYRSILTFESQFNTGMFTVTFDLIGLNAFELDLMYRVYYMLMFQDTPTYFGHGDFVLTDDRSKYNNKPYI